VTAKLLPFPLASRHGYVKKQAARLALFEGAAASSILSQQLDLQRQVLLRRGFAATTVDEEISALETAIRSHVTCSIRGGAVR
jgi:hypothetical protein